MALSFLQRDYELKIKYLSNHFSRMWTLFNFFLVLEPGLSAALWVWFKEEGQFAQVSSTLAYQHYQTSGLVSPDGDGILDNCDCTDVYEEV
jgi:hypothetical protein